LVAGHAQNLGDGLGRDFAEDGNLVEIFDGVADAAVGEPSDHPERLGGRGEIFCVRNRGEAGDEQGFGDAIEGENLTAGNDGVGDFVDFGGREDENEVGAGFLHRFEEGVEGVF
jgi:hypothetical protein